MLRTYLHSRNKSCVFSMPEDMSSIEFKPSLGRSHQFLSSSVLGTALAENVRPIEATLDVPTYPDVYCSWFPRKTPLSETNES